jgi:hypothetical protein
MLAPLTSPIFRAHCHAQGGNTLGPEGAGKLAGALEQMTGMHTLGLVRGSGMGVEWKGWDGGWESWDGLLVWGGRELTRIVHALRLLQGG